MKKAIFIVCLSFTAGTAFSQFYPSNTGDNLTTIGADHSFRNVGIGVDDPGILRQLHIYRNIDMLTLGFPFTIEGETVGMRLQSEYSNLDIGGENPIVGDVSSIWDNMIDYRGFHLFDRNEGIRRFSILNESGFTGINTWQPQGRLDVNSGEEGYTDALYVRAHASSPHQGGIMHHQQAEYAWQEVAQATDNDNNSSLRFHFTYRETPGELVKQNVLLLHSTGRVGIMNNSPQYELDVAGTIRACEVLVNLNGGWCDYVFDEKYKLTPIEEVEKFIKENRHLPDVPAEREVMEKGINVGEMDAILLKKIEELTLYVIDQNKKIKSLTQQIKESQEENISVKRQLEAISQIGIK